MRSLTTDEAEQYVISTNGDELDAAIAFAYDCITDDDTDVPGPQEVHHCLYLIFRAIGKDPPSWDDTRVALVKKGIV